MRHKLLDFGASARVFLLFTSGNLVITGAKKEEEVYRAVTILKKTLEEKELIRYEKERQ